MTTQETTKPANDFPLDGDDIGKPDRRLSMAPVTYSAVLEVQSAGGQHWLNTSIIPPGADGTWQVQTVTTGDVWHLGYAATQLYHEGQGQIIQSHIGHQATADLAQRLLGSKIGMNRMPWDGSGLGIALQLLGRPKEGQILTLAEMESAGYVWRLIYRTA